MAFSPMQRKLHTYTHKWVKDRMKAVNPVLYETSPFRFLINKKSLNDFFIIDLEEKGMLVNGKFIYLNKLSDTKLFVYQLLYEAHILFWSLPAELRENHLGILSAYYTTYLNTEHLISSLKDETSEVVIDNCGVQSKIIKISFPPHVKGYIKQYHIQDRLWTSRGVRYTARTIEPNVV